MSDVAPWLTSMPLLTRGMRDQVVSAYRQGLMQAPLPVLLVDLEGRLLAVNPEAQEQVGRDEADLYGSPVEELAHEDDRPAIVAARRRLAREQSRREDLEARWTRPDGRVGWCRLHVFRVEDEVSGRGCLVALVKETTDQRFAQQQALAMVEAGRLITAGAPLAVVAGQLAGVAGDRWSGVGCALTVLDAPREVLVPVAHDRLPAGYLDRLPEIPVADDGGACGNAVLHDSRVAISDVTTDPRAARFRDVLAEYEVISAWSVPVHDPAGRPIGALGLFHTVQVEPADEDWQVLEVLAGIAGMAVFVESERRRLQLERAETRRDALTRLPNTVSLLGSIAAHCSAPEAFSLAVVRLHDVGDLSSALGDDAATLVLRQLAERAETFGDVRAVALVGSMTLAIAASGAWTAHEADLVRRILRRPLQVGALTVRPQIRVGLTVKAAGQVVAPETLLRQATVAVPDEGVATFDAGVADGHLALYALAAEISRALRHDELVVHYQPQYDLVDGRPVGSEALVRWQHPERGLLAPGSFLPAVARASAGPDLALHVIRRVLADRAERIARGLVGKVAVNLNAEDVRQDQVVEFLCDPEEARWEHLEIELTETSLADPHCLEALERLAAAGYAVALDDFGTGYSSLSALHRMPLAAVKIDRSFVQRLPGDRAAEALVGAVAAMCTQLGLRVVAEGIETPEQAEAVRRLGCGTGQGFLLRRPSPLRDLDGSPAPVPQRETEP